MHPALKGWINNWFKSVATVMLAGDGHWALVNWHFPNVGRRLAVSTRTVNRASAKKGLYNGFFIFSLSSICLPFTTPIRNIPIRKKCPKFGWSSTAFPSNQPHVPPDYWPLIHLFPGNRKTVSFNMKWACNFWSFVQNYWMKIIMNTRLIKTLKQVEKLWINTISAIGWNFRCEPAAGVFCSSHTQKWKSYQSYFLNP